MNYLIYFAELLLVAQQVHCSFNLTIAHTNDVHARVEEFNKYGGHCKNDSSQKCYGGVARRHTVLRDLIRGKYDNVLLLDGGDEFQGTVWYNVYKGLASARFMNYLGYDAMALGNHEFDDGPEGVIKFIRNTTFPVLACNVDTTKEPSWPNDVEVKKSVIVTKGGVQIGIIGYITQDTKWLSNPGPNIRFLDVIDSVRAEAQRLEGLGVHILIALGHAGIEMDRMVAVQIHEIDVVVGGHSNTFLYNGEKPLNDEIEGPYPIMYVRNDGSRVAVVQDFAYGKYLGKLNLEFDDSGKLTSWSGNPIILSDVYKQDDFVLKMVEEMNGPILKHRTDMVGRSLVHLDGHRTNCRKAECNMGNLVIDACVKISQQTPDEMNWATVALGVWNSGGIRNSIDKKRTENASCLNLRMIPLLDPITMEDLMSVVPFGNTADIVEIYGKELSKVFEHSVSVHPVLKGRFLQISGFKVKYNVKKPVGNRVVELKALCIACRIPHYQKVKNNQIYKVIMPSYIIGGGDEFNFTYLKRHQGDVAASYLYNYVKKEEILSTPVEGRIEFIDNSEEGHNDSNTLHIQRHFMYLVLSVSFYILFSK